MKESQQRTESSSVPILKFVIKLCHSDIPGRADLDRLGQVICQLLSDRHRVVLVHGNREVGESQCDNCGPKLIRQSKGPLLVQCEVAPEMLYDNKLLVSVLGSSGVPAFGLCGWDGNMVRLRRHRGSSPDGQAEAAIVQPFWLDAISERGGVPVLASAGLLGGDWRNLHPDRFAAACAVGWSADVLILLVRQEGVRNRDGILMRWLDVEAIREIAEERTNEQLVSGLDACRTALENGVRRARILPVACIDSLAEFYFRRIEHGTEIVIMNSAQRPAYPH